MCLKLPLHFRSLLTKSSTAQLPGQKPPMRGASRLQLRVLIKIQPSDFPRKDKAPVAPGGHPWAVTVKTHSSLFWAMCVVPPGLGTPCLGLPPGLGRNWLCSVDSSVKGRSENHSLWPGTEAPRDGFHTCCKAGRSP